MKAIFREREVGPTHTRLTEIMVWIIYTEYDEEKYVEHVLRRHCAIFERVSLVQISLFLPTWIARFGSGPLNSEFCVLVKIKSFAFPKNVVTFSTVVVLKLLFTIMHFRDML